jgi:hypothetical protein
VWRHVLQEANNRPHAAAKSTSDERKSSTRRGENTRPSLTGVLYYCRTLHSYQPLSRAAALRVVPPVCVPYLYRHKYEDTPRCAEGGKIVAKADEWFVGPGSHAAPVAPSHHPSF